jgi:RNA polymerase sigma factor (sigma-70 family)
VIGYAVRRLLDGRWFTRGETADLVQELALHAHAASQTYDPSKSGHNTYYSRVLGRRAIDLTRRAAAAKRDRRRERPLDENDPEVARPAPQPTVERQVDLAAALAELSRADQALAAALADHSLLEAARRLGLSREQARAASPRIARHLVGRGLA